MEKETQKKLIHRLNRAQGQINALKKIIEEDQKSDCKLFISQVKAARSALKGVSEQYVLAYIHTCQALPKKVREKQVEEAIKVLASD